MESQWILGSVIPYNEGIPSSWILGPEFSLRRALMKVGKKKYDSLTVRMENTNHLKEM